MQYTVLLSDTATVYIHVAFIVPPQPHAARHRAVCSSDWHQFVDFFSRFCFRAWFARATISA